MVVVAARAASFNPAHSSEAWRSSLQRMAEGAAPPSDLPHVEARSSSSGPAAAVIGHPGDDGVVDSSSAVATASGAGVVHGPGADTPATPATVGGSAAPGGFRALYAGGAEKHYSHHGGTYRNPHEAAVRKALLTALPFWGLVPAAKCADVPVHTLARLIQPATGSGAGAGGGGAAAAAGAAGGGGAAGAGGGAGAGAGGGGGGGAAAAAAAGAGAGGEVDPGCDSDSALDCGAGAATGSDTTAHVAAVDGAAPSDGTAHASVVAGAGAGATLGLPAVPVLSSAPLLSPDDGDQPPPCPPEAAPRSAAPVAAPAAVRLPAAAPSATPPRFQLRRRSAVLDLAAGSGEATLLLQAVGLTHVTGCDPYTGAAYAERVGTPAQSWSFQDVANGCLGDAVYDLCVCCYALHLVEESWVSAVLWELARCCRALMVVSPHKKPVIPPANGWEPATPAELRVDRVRVRLLWSTLLT